MSTQTLDYQVSLTLGESITDFDIPGIVEEITERYGNDLTDIDAIPGGEYTDILKRHDLTVVTLYETNGDLLVLSRGSHAWSLHLGGPHMDGAFAADAKAWVEGDWEPNEGDGQNPTNTDDLTPVAQWAIEGVELLVDVEQMGAAARAYLGF